MTKTFHEHCADAKKNIKEVTISEVMDMRKNNEDIMLIDVREDNEWEKGHIKGAIHIGKGIIERDIHLHVPSHNTRMVLYCGGGYRSALAAESLQKMGYSNVMSMDGGWRGWNSQGGETV